MQARALAVLVVASCSGGSAQHDAAAPPVDAADSGCGIGTTVVTRQIAAGCGEPGAPAAPGCMAGGLTLVTSPPDDPRLFVIEQAGRIRIIDDHEQVVAAPFLDISGIVLAGGEQGLLGLAFHPDYATNRRFYVFYTATNPDAADTANPFVNVLARYTGATDPDHADAASGTILLSIPDFAGNHNGGMIEFGADGYLYVSTGDGGGNTGDPEDNGQDPRALLGKMLRLDVDHPAGATPYGIPADNPFADGTLGAPEVFLLGLRNPWRWSFDRATGDLWLADVGQNSFEEIDVLRAGEQNGKNLGWSMYEALACFKPPCDPRGVVFPQHVRSHAVDLWTAIIGGQVYRGSCYPRLAGSYFFTDNGFGHLARARLQSDGSLAVDDLPGEFPPLPSSLHEAGRGELYETDVLGNVFRIEARR